MAEPRRKLTTADLVDLARAAFGRRTLRSVERLSGGSKKGVYRLTLADGGTAIGYLWHPGEDYWPTPAGGAAETGPFAHATGLDLFEAAHAELSAIGVRVPRLLLVDRGTLVEGDVAVLEDVRGGTLQDLLNRDPQRAEPVLDRLAGELRTMHQHRSPRYGRPTPLTVGRPQPLSSEGSSAGGGSLPVAEPVEDVVLGRALRHLTASADRVEQLAVARQGLAELLHQRRAAISPRTEYRLIHGELGPDHVFLDDQNAPVLIDIEGAMFLDVEWEHVFLELRFGEYYRQLRNADPDLDGDRLSFYRLAQYLSLVEGPLRLLDGDFPQRELMQQIARHNIGRTLAQLA